MTSQLYSVTATLPISMIDDYLAWLDRHIDEVVQAGALDARVIVYHPSDQSQQVETQYTFADKHAFDSYERDHAPRLREEGKRLFASKSGVQFTRKLGEIHFRRG